MSGRYILVGQTPVPCEDIREWGRSFSQDRVVKQERIGPYFVSTVFLGVDHNFGTGSPMLFETMVFLESDESRPAEDYCERCGTWLEAEQQHVAAVSVYQQKLAGDVEE